MKIFIAIIIIIITLVIVNDNMISFQESKDDFKIDYQNTQKDFNQVVNNYSKEASQKQFSSNENNNVVTKVDNEIAAKKIVNKDEKIYKDEFERNFDETNKYIQNKWKNF